MVQKNHTPGKAAMPKKFNTIGHGQTRREQEFADDRVVPQTGDPAFAILDEPSLEGGIKPGQDQDRTRPDPPRLNPSMESLGGIAAYNQASAEERAYQPSIADAVETVNSVTEGREAQRPRVERPVLAADQSINTGSAASNPSVSDPVEFSIPSESKSKSSVERPILRDERRVGSGLSNHFVAGWQNQAGDETYARSVIGDTVMRRRFPEVENSSSGEKVAYTLGRIAGDIQGYGTRKNFWNMHPEDAVGTAMHTVAGSQGLSAPERQLARYAAATALPLLSGNLNPFNIAEGGRTAGFAAVNPEDPEDPRKPENAISELLFDRGMLGRTGKLLPWEEFRQERPDVSYEKYAKYQDYIRSPAFLGLIKGTMDGIDGPEVRLVGNRAQPESVLAALAAGAAVVGGFKYLKR